MCRIFILTIIISIIMNFGVAAYSTTFPPGRVYFSPEHDLESETFGFISSASKHIYIFTEKLDSELIVNELINKKAKYKIAVRILLPATGVDQVLIQKLRDARIELITGGGGSGFNGTFIEIDNNKVLLSPHALSYSTLKSDRNYLFIIDNHLLSKNFVNEFNEMFIQASYGSTSNPEVENPHIESPPAVIETFFLPENDPSLRFYQILDGAETSIYLTAESLNSSPIAQKLIEKKKSGVDIKVFTGSLTNDNRDIYEKLKYNGIDVLEKKFSVDQTNSLLDFAVIDGRYLILPMKNYFAGEASSNDSYSLLIDSTETSSIFINEFNYIYSKIVRGTVLRGYVRDELTNQSIRDVKVTVRNSGSVTHIEDFNIIPDSGVVSYTDKYGIYSFKSLDTGSVLLTIEKDNYFSLEKIVEISSTLKNIDFKMKTIEKSGSLRGKIENSYNSTGIENIDVYVEYIENNSGIITQVHEKSGPDGWFKCKNVPIGKVRIRINNPSYITPEPFFVNIENGKLKELDVPIKLIPKYKVTAIPNPIFPDNIFITIKSYLHNDRIPEVSVTQKDYVPIEVKMRYLISGEKDYTVFSGNYRIKNGYWGKTIIDINHGEVKSEFNIGFIEAGSRYTFFAPEKTKLEFYKVKGSGIISAFPAHIDTLNKEFSQKNLSGIKVNGPEELLYSKDSKIIMENKNKKLKIYRKIGDKFQMVENRYENNLHYAYFSQYGDYYLLEDIKKPEIVTKNGDIEITDNGSGVDELTLVVTQDGKKVSFTKKSIKNGFIIRPDIDSKKNINIEVSDKSGNKIGKTIFYAPVPVSFEKLEIYPNPLKNGENVSIILKGSYLSKVTFSIYDSSGRKIIEKIDNFLIKNHIFNWNIRDKRGRMVSNGTYFVLVKENNSGKVLEKGKISILR